MANVQLTVERGWRPPKLALYAALSAWVALPYFALQRFPIFPVTVLRPGALERLVPLSEWTVWLYISFFLATPLALWLLPYDDALRRYAPGHAAISLASHAAFFLFPTAIAREGVVASGWAYRALLSVDAPLNACPSLHASLAIYSSLCCEWAIRTRRRAWLWRGLLWLWTLAAIYALALWLIPGQFLLHAWLVPVLLVGLMVNIRGFTQHGITDAHDAFVASRSIRPHPVVAFCLLNENYHLEHHLFPEVPSYHLPALHRLVWEQLPRAAFGTSYLGFLGSFLRASLTLDDSPIGLVTRAQRGRDGT